MNWRGSIRDWAHYERVYAQFAWLATPLVLSVHSVVSFDFAVSLIPGWHTTIFPPYFVAGAIFSGFGMVITLMVPMRKWLKLEHIITINHLDLCNKVILFTSIVVGYAYIMEFIIAWYSEAQYERAQFLYRLLGMAYFVGETEKIQAPLGGMAHAWAFWTMFICNVVIPQVFWSKKMRRNLTVMFIISIFVNIGMWFERFNIFILSLEHDFLPSNWSYFKPTMFDMGVTLGSFGLFFTLFLGFCRVLPTLAIAEVKTVLHKPAQRVPERDLEVVAWPEAAQKELERQTPVKVKVDNVVEDESPPEEESKSPDEPESDEKKTDGNEEEPS